MNPEWINSNIVRFNFNNINLLDSLSNEPKSHGSVTFKVKLKPNLAVNTQIKNKGYIYFDNNNPIITNTALNTIVNPQAIQVIDENHNFSIYPNPAQNQLHIELKKYQANHNFNASIYAINGQLLLNKNLQSQHEILDLKKLSTGIYFIRLQANQQVFQYKFVKE
jgi:hypothetical protein